MPNQAILHIVRAMMASHVVSPAYCRAASGELTPGHGHWRFYATRKNYTVTKLWVIIQKVFGMTELGLIQIYVLHGRSSQTLCSIGSLALCSLHHHYNVSRNSEPLPSPKLLADKPCSVKGIFVVPQIPSWQ